MQQTTFPARLPLAAALEQLLSGREPVEPRKVTLKEAIGFTAAQDVPAALSLPVVTIAGRDGWAVPFAAIAGATLHSPVPLPSGLVWVNTGDPMPDGTDTVLPPEAVEGDQKVPEAIADAPLGDGAIQAGAEFTTGDVVIEAGTVITAAHLLALSYLGEVGVLVRTPRVSLLTAGASPERQAIGPVLAALIADAGCVIASTGPAPIDFEDLANAVTVAAAQADAVILLGGSGYGRADRSADALSWAGTLKAHGLALRPGETAGFGEVAGRAVLILPGRPDAALATFLTLGRPLLRWLAGVGEPSRYRTMPLGRKLSSSIGWSEVVFARQQDGTVEPLGSNGTPLHRLLRADTVFLVPPEQEGYPEGTPIEIMPLWTSR